MMVSIISFNILKWGIGRETEIISTIKASNPDVVFLQEVYDENILVSLSSSLGMSYKFVKGNSKRHLGLMSRLPIKKLRVHRQFPPIRRAALEVCLEYAPGKYFYIFGVHLQALHGLLFEFWRLWEVSQLIQATKQKFLAGEPCLIAGDFNAIAPGDKIIEESMPLYLRGILLLQGAHIFRFAINSILKRGLYDCFRFVNKEDDGFTLPTANPNARLDYFLPIKRWSCV